MTDGASGVHEVAPFLLYLLCIDHALSPGFSPNQRTVVVLSFMAFIIVHKSTQRPQTPPPAPTTTAQVLEFLRYLHDERHVVHRPQGAGAPERVRRVVGC